MASSSFAFDAIEVEVSSCEYKRFTLQFWEPDATAEGTGGKGGQAFPKLKMPGKTADKSGGAYLKGPGNEAGGS
jgi:hypothetical protein